MKRRNAGDCCTGKPRRPLKRPGKIADGIYASIFMYLKFFLVWALVLLADFILEFRFEYLWPFWLALQSAYDCYKFQGLAFSIFFVCITITSDVACYLFIPVQWLMFTASTYVWVQYVWQTERGGCLPSILLSFLFLYIEVGVRLRDLKSFPFHLDLCRPFAAHCVGYPVITLGFSFKSCISHRFRLKKQHDVQRENDFHMRLLQDALPLTDSASVNDKLKALPSQSPEDVVANGTARSSLVVQNGRKPSSSSSSSGSDNICKDREAKRPGRVRDAMHDFEFLEQSLNRQDQCENDADDLENDGELGIGDLRSDNNHIGIIKNAVKSNIIQKQGSITLTLPSGVKRNKAINITAAPCLSNRETQCSRLESDMKRLQSDLQISRNTEQELRSQINNLSTNERITKTELQQLRQDNENLQSKLHKLVTSRQQEKKNLANIEKKLQDEKRQRVTLEQQLTTEKSEKRRKAEEAAAAAAATRANAANNSSRMECTLDLCKTRCWELESELKQSHQDLKLKEDYIRQLEHETQTLQQYRESQNDAEVLMSALGAMQDKNTHLESSLSAETRLKLDLFSALGEAKRQIEIQQGLMIQKEVELADLKSKVAEVMAFIPTSPSSFSAAGNGILGIRYSPPFRVAQMPNIEEDMLCKSSLNPAASDYTPKITQ